MASNNLSLNFIFDEYFLHQMNLFYCSDIAGSVAVLSAEESLHCVKVLRLKEGDAVFVADGKGGFYRGQLTGAHYKQCTVTIHESKMEYGKRKFNIHLAVAPTKNIERFEWFLEKATEIGINEITPLICRRSERKEVKTERLNKVLVSAMKQSISAYLPLLYAPVKFSDLMKMKLQGQKLIAHLPPSGSGMQPAHLKSLYIPPNDVMVLVGPEGDFSPEEVEAAVQNGFTLAALGNSRLRTETAALAACHIINLLND